MDPRSRYTVLKSAVQKCTDKKKIQAGIEYFFRVHENKECPPLEERMLKSLLLELAGETINRDYILYITTGTWGTTANELLRIIS